LAFIYVLKDFSLTVWGDFNKFDGAEGPVNGWREVISLYHPTDLNGTYLGQIQLKIGDPIADGGNIQHHGNVKGYPPQTDIFHTVEPEIPLSPVEGDVNGMAHRRGYPQITPSFLTFIGPWHHCTLILGSFRTSGFANLPLPAEMPRYKLRINGGRKQEKFRQ